MSSIFSKIVSKEIPSHTVAEDENYLAFLDINPLQEGHTLVIPKQETDYLFDLDDETYAGLFNFAKRVAKAIEAVVECKRIGIAVVGFEVPHAHIHLIPIDDIYDIDFKKERVKMSEEEFGATAEKIRVRFS